MKIIGSGKTRGCGDKTYIAEIGHEELEKFLNLYYGKMTKLEAGEEVDLGRGYDFAREIKDAVRKTHEFISSHQKIIEAIFNGINIVALTKEEK